MKKFQTLLSLLLAALATAPGSSWAVSGDVTVGVASFMGDQNNAKFREYNYGDGSPFGAYTKLNLFSAPSEDRFYKMKLSARTPEDLDLGTEWGTYGTYKFDLGLRRFGHNFAEGVSTLYSGFGTDHLTIPNSIQSTMQSASTTTLPSLLRSAVGSAGKADLRLRRDQADASLAWTPKEDLSVDVGINYEKRLGTRPYGATFGSPGTTQLVEIAEPINYDTTRTREGMEYTGKVFSAGVRHELSLFNNAYRSVSYDNPFRLTDAAAAAAVGRNALAPDNMANHFSVSLASKALPLRSRLSANAIMGLLKQNDDLLPPSNNTSTAGYPYPLPRSKAGAEVTTGLYDFRFTSEPAKKLHVKADYRYDQRLNRTPAFSLAAGQWSTTDSSTAAAVTSEYVSSIERKTEFETAYDVAARTSVSASAANIHSNFNGGSAKKENENIYKLGMSTQKFSWTTLRLSLERSLKSTDYPDYTAADGELPWLRKYYAASKNTSRAVAMATVDPTDNLAASLEYIYGVDKYPASLFGLQKGDHQTVSADLDYSLGSRVTISPSYTFELYNTRQESRQWTATIGNPFLPAYNGLDAFGNWTLKTQDTSHTPALTVGLVLIPEKLNLKTTGSVTKDKTRLRFASPVGIGGATGNDGNAFVPVNPNHADASTLIALNSFLDYKVRQDLSLGLGYSYQRWKVKDDFMYDGVTEVPVSGSGAFIGPLNMNTLYKPYNVHTVYVQSSYRF